MPQVITAALLAGLFTGFKTSFNSGFAGKEPAYGRVATTVPSSAAAESYAWLGDWPGIREWIGDRQIKELGASTYSIANRRFEGTVRVNADKIRDDQIGIYAPMFEEQGRAVRAFPDALIFALLANGHVAKCFDGMPFFDDEHPVGAGLGVNITDGAGAPWFLLDTTRALKPLIFQDREKFDLVALDDPRDANVFMRNEFIYGTTGRCEAGFGFWQMAHRSKATLDGTNFGAARAAMSSLKSDEGKPLGITPNLLVVPPSLETAGRTLLNAEQIGDTTNVWRGTAELLVVPELA